MIVLAVDANTAVALAALVIGGLAAKAFGNTVRATADEAGLSNPNLLAKIASGVVWSFTIILAVNQIGIATTLVNTLFSAVVGAVALALGLSFGLGGRETAGKIVKNWYGKDKEHAEEFIKSSEATSQIVTTSGESRSDTTTRH